MRSEFENWFKTSRSYLALKEANYYDLNLFEFNESYKRYVHSGIQIAFETWQRQQSKVDELEEKLHLRRTENKALLNKINNSELPKQLIEQGQRLNAQSRQIASLKWQLSKVGFTDNGGELMKPPLGDPPNYLSECEKLNRLG